MRGLPGLQEAAALVMTTNPTEDRSDTMENGGAMLEAYLAGYLTGRGGFGSDGEKWWLYIVTLDHALASAAMDLWGGHITERRTRDGDKLQYKFTADSHEVRGILETLAPYLMGVKLDKAEDLLGREALNATT